MAIGKALDTLQERRTRDSLHALLLAQQEHHATVAQAITEMRADYKDSMMDARADYKDSLMDAVQRLAESVPKAEDLDSAEVIRCSVGQITSAFSRYEHWAKKVISVIQEGNATQQVIAQKMSALLENGHVIVELLKPPQTDRPGETPRPCLSVVRSGGADVLEEIAEEEED